MKRRAAAVLCGLLLTASAARFAAATAPAATAWHLMWSDEFNGADDSMPDATKWNVVSACGGFGNHELECYTTRRENVHQAAGNLVITARREEYTGGDGVVAHYTSARLNTQGHFAQAYGRFEARMKLPSGKGLWPAFWLLGGNEATVGWPKTGEIDIMENIGEAAKTYSTLHGPGYSGAQALSSPFTLPDGDAVNNGYHLYAVEWEPRRIRFYVDRAVVVERTPADLPTDAAWAYDHSFFLLLNLAVGGDWPGSPDATTVFPQQLLIDYVRVYQRSDASGAGARGSQW